MTVTIERIEQELEVLNQPHAMVHSQ